MSYPQRCGINISSTVSNVGNSKPPQWDGKSYLMWKIKFSAHLTMLGLEDCLMPEFVSELPAKEKDTFDLTFDKGKNRASAVKQEGNDTICALLSESCSIKQAQLCNKSQ
jgi:hypothetical protein